MDRENPGFVELDSAETLDAVVLERLLPIADPVAPPLRPTVHGRVRQLMVVNLEVLSHERPVQLTGPISGVQYACEQLGGRHRNSILARRRPRWTRRKRPFSSQTRRSPRRASAATGA